MRWHGPIRDVGWPFVNADEVLDGARQELHLARPTKPLLTAEIAGEFPLQGPTGEHVEMRVDGFRARSASLARQDTDVALGP